MQSFITCTWRLNNEIGTQRNDQGRPFLYLLDKEVIKDKENRCLEALIRKEF